MTPSTYATPWGTFQDYPGTIVGRTLAEGRAWDAHLLPYIDEAALRLPAAGYGWAIDVGAYIGFHTVYMAKQFMHVVAVEPVLPTVELLQANLRANRVENVTVLPLAGYHRECLLRRALQADTGWDSRLPEHAPSVPWFPCSGTAEVVPAARLDLYCQRPGTLALVKVDAQGADLRVLEGLTRRIVDHKPLILLEWEEGYAAHHRTEWRDVERWAKGVGYAITRITTDFCDYVLRPS